MRCGGGSGGDDDENDEDEEDVDYDNDDYDYHHRPDEVKISSVADMLGTYGRPKVIAEMKKCDIVCKECHRDIHDNLGNPHQARNPKTGRFMKHTL